MLFCRVELGSQVSLEETLKVSRDDIDYVDRLFVDSFRSTINRRREGFEDRLQEVAQIRRLTTPCSATSRYHIIEVIEFL